MAGAGPETAAPGGGFIVAAAVGDAFHHGL